MTVALGLVCIDGVLIASDSKATGEGFASQVTKVHKFDRIPAIWTAAGSVFVMEEVSVVLEKEDTDGTPTAAKAIYTKPDPPVIRNVLHGKINKVMREAYAKCLSAGPPVNGMVALPFGTPFLILGYANSTPWFLELAADGQANWHTDQGFYAVGSGGPFATVAHALMEHYTLNQLTLDEGMKLAYRVIDTTIRSSPFGVGPPVQIAICNSTGPRILTEDEISDLSSAVEAWKQLERETLKLGRVPEELRAEDKPAIPEMRP